VQTQASDVKENDFSQQKLHLFEFYAIKHINSEMLEGLNNLVHAQKTRITFAAKLQVAPLSLPRALLTTTTKTDFFLEIHFT